MKNKFNKFLDFTVPFLIGCGLVLIIISFNSEASVRLDINDIVTDDRTSTQDCLVTTLYFESRSESDMANIMVLNTIFNRTNSPHYPDTPCEVIKQYKQYSYTHDGLSDRMVNLVQVKRLEHIVNKFLLNRELFLSLSEGSDHYHTTDVKPYWIDSDRMKYIGTYDKHIFYRRD